MSSNGSAVMTGVPNVQSLLGERDGRELEKGGWFTRLVHWYLARRYKAAHQAPVDARGETETERAHSVITRACVKSAVTGASAGLLSTGATVLTAETEGLGALIAVPAAAAAIGGEMVYRALVHLDMACDLADIFAVKINPDDPRDFWAIYALAFRKEKDGAAENSEEVGRNLVERVVEFESHEVGETIGSKLVGESVARNIVPFVGVVVSSVGNWRLTRRVGDTIRRYYRYRRALNDAFEEAAHMCSAHMDLLVEGFWFIFTADGQLNAEEAAVLGGLLRKLDEPTRDRVVSNLTEDEYEWAERIRELPEGIRDPFLYALNVAAAVDKSVTLPERKILRRAARKLGREFRIENVNEMIRQFEDVGVLKD